MYTLWTNTCNQPEIKKQNNAGEQQEREVKKHRIYIQKLQHNKCEMKKKRLKNGQERIDKAITEENFPELKKDMSI